ncbi:MAG: rRNA maturation RNase YbeY [Clostridiales bacterium GWF2_36_10]|nr:MAG: rRNA maturation RNase YbeY [Clostridiales bacterium GWF2_36_10]HAN21694.1 rRNA maturation RNase YbeY [Clostridiales bacterium]
MTRVFYENLTEQLIPDSYITLMKRCIRICIANEYPVHKFEVNLTVCDNDYIHELNKQHRGKDAPTDVLSFPFYDFDTPEVTTLLGDIIISIDKAKEQAATYGHSLKRELCFLAVHSALHLLGYDHEDEEEREMMEQKQKELLDSLGIKR